MAILDSFSSLFCCGEAASSTKSAPPATNNEADSTIQEDKNSTQAEHVKNLPPADPQNTKNYFVVHLTRPMGILFEENLDQQHAVGGSFIAEIKEGCSAAADGTICSGDQLVGIGNKRVSGMEFSEVMKIIEGSDDKITLTVFRGPAKSLSGASAEWLDAFLEERMKYAAQVDEKDSLDDVAAEVRDAVTENVKAELCNDVATAVHDAVGDIDKEADETPVDVTAHVEEKSTPEDELVVVDDEVEMDEWVDTEADGEKEATEEEDVVVLHNDVAVEKEIDSAAEGEVVIENDVKLDGESERDCNSAVVTEADETVGVDAKNEVEADEGASLEADQEKEADTPDDEPVVVADNETGAEEAATGEDDLKKESDTPEDEDEALLVVDNEVESEEAVDREADQEKETNTTEDEAVVVVENETDEEERVAECDADLEKEVDTPKDEALVAENEVEAEEAADGEDDLEIEAGTTDETLDKLDLETQQILKVIVENQVKAADEEVSRVHAQETDGADNTNTSIEDLLDIDYAGANTDESLISINSTALASVD